MGISCDPNDLANAAKQFQKLFPEHAQWVDTYLLAVIAGGSTDPSVLALAAKDFQKLDPEWLKIVEIYLLCQINGGGGGPVTPCPQDMLWAWTPTSVTNFGQDFRYAASSGLPGVTSISFSGSSVGGLEVSGTGITSASFPNLTASSGNFDFTSNGALTALSAPLLATVAGEMALNNNNFSNLNFPSLTTVSGGGFIADSNGLLTSISLPLLTNVNGDFSAQPCASLASVSAPNLTSVGGNLLLGDVNSAFVLPLTSVVLTSLTTIVGNFSFCSQQPTMLTLTFPALVSVAGNFSTRGTTLTSLNLPSLTSFGGSVDGDASNLVTWNAPNVIFTDGSGIDYHNAALNAASVNSILHRAVVSGVTTCTIALQGGTNAAPSGAGIADKATLIAAGNTVTTN